MDEKKIVELQEESTKLLLQIRERYELLEKDRITKGDLETFRAKVDDRLNAIDTEMAKAKSPGRGALQTTEKEMGDFRGWLETSRKMGIAALAGASGAPEQKVLTIADSTHAGVLAPYEYVNEIIKKITEYSPLRQLATIRQTSAYAVELPTRTAIGVATWVNESAEKTETTGLTYALTEIPTFEMKILYKATQKMLEDSRFNLEAEIADADGRGFGLLEGSAFYNGNGTTAPEGILTNTAVLADAKDVATDNTLVFDDFIKAQYLLASPYAKNASWLMNRSLVGVLMGLKNATTNSYILQPDAQAGFPMRMLGSPIYEDPNFPAIVSTTLTDGQIVCAYGDFRAGYTIVDRVDIYIQRLIEKYAEFGMIGFLARKRVGAAVVLPEAIQILKNITT